MSQTNQVFLLIFLIIATGFLIKKLNFISEKDGKIISKLLMHSTFPALMIISTAQLKFESSLLFLSLGYIIAAISMMGIGRFVFLKYPNKLKGLFLMAMGGVNTGLFGFPIIEGLYGKQALTYAIMIDIGNTLVIFCICYPLGKYFSKTSQEQFGFNVILKKIFCLPPFLGMLLGLTINMLGVKLPAIIYTYLEVLAKGNMPIGLLLLGIYLSFDLSKNEIIGVLKQLTIRYGFMLILVIILLFILPNSTYRNAVLICCFLPLGLSNLPFSDEMNYDTKVAGTLVNLSLIFSFFMMWGLVAFVI
jgi:malate permease and related proteins